MTCSPLSVIPPSHSKPALSHPSRHPGSFGDCWTFALYPQWDWCSPTLPSSGAACSELTSTTTFLVLGLLAVALSLARPRDQWAPLPGRCGALDPASFAGIRPDAGGSAAGRTGACTLTRPQPRHASRRWTGSEPKSTSLRSSVSPVATFQSFLLLCGYVIVFLLVRELTWRFADRRWLAIWPIVAIGALEAALGLCQNFGRGRGPSSVGDIRQPQPLRGLPGDGAAVCGGVPRGALAAHALARSTRPWLRRSRLAACGRWRD